LPVIVGVFDNGARDEEPAEGRGEFVIGDGTTFPTRLPVLVGMFDAAEGAG
jgi:hypothetical protein